MEYGLRDKYHLHVLKPLPVSFRLMSLLVELSESERRESESGRRWISMIKTRGPFLRRVVKLESEDGTNASNCSPLLWFWVTFGEVHEATKHKDVGITLENPSLSCSRLYSPPTPSRLSRLCGSPLSQIISLSLSP